MSWELLAGAAESQVREGYDLAFRVVTSKGSERLRITISAKVMGVLRWTEETRLELHLGRDKDAGRCRLVEVDKSKGRKISIQSMGGKGQVNFVYTVAVAMVFNRFDAMVELTRVEYSPDGAALKITGRMLDFDAPATDSEQVAFFEQQERELEQGGAES